MAEWILDGQAGCSLDSIPMIKRIRRVLGWTTRWFGAPAKGPARPTDRGRLVGMYLSDANGPAGPSRRWSGNQERENGRFAQTRRRD